MHNTYIWSQFSLYLSPLYMHNSQSYISTTFDTYIYVLIMH